MIIDMLYSEKSMSSHLDFSLDIFDGIGSFNFEGDCLSSQSFHEDLHSTSESKDEMKGRFLLDVIVRQGSAVFELLSSEDESLLVWWDSFFVLDLSLDILDGVGRFDLKGDRLASESLDKDLHATSESEDEMESRLLLDVVIRKSSAVFELLSSEDESLLVWGNSLLVLKIKRSKIILDGINPCFRVRKYGESKIYLLLF